MLRRAMSSVLRESFRGLMQNCTAFVISDFLLIAVVLSID